MLKAGAGRDGEDLVLVIAGERTLQVGYQDLIDGPEATQFLEEISPTVDEVLEELLEVVGHIVSHGESRRARDTHRYLDALKGTIIQYSMLFESVIEE